MQNSRQRQQNITFLTEIFQTVPGLPIRITNEPKEDPHHNYFQQQNLVIYDEIEKIFHKNVITRHDHKKQETFPLNFPGRKQMHYLS